VLITKPFLSTTAQVPICSSLGVLLGLADKPNGLAPIKLALLVVPSGLITGGRLER
jgi:hypothetical protein